MSKLGKSQQKLLNLVNGVFKASPKTNQEILESINGTLETNFTSKSGVEAAIKSFDLAHDSRDIGAMKNAFSDLRVKSGKSNKYAHFSKAKERAAEIGLIHD